MSGEWFGVRYAMATLVVQHGPKRFVHSKATSNLTGSSNQLPWLGLQPAVMPGESQNRLVRLLSSDVGI